MQASFDSAELPDDPRLMQAVQEFLDQLEAGRRPNSQEFLRRYADLAEPLAQCLAGLELVHKSAGSDKKPSGGKLFPHGGPEYGLPANPLGDFQIVREVGRGGMGIVYEAVQLSLGRRVALKVLPFAATLDAKHLQRFQNEAHTAALLHHTNIVPVYAVGQDRGVHFYAMQLIDGHSLALVIRQIRLQVDGGPAPADSHEQVFPKVAGTEGPSTIGFSKVLPIPPNPGDQETSSLMAAAMSTHRTNKREKFFTTAVRLVLQAGEALEHAHQLGIVHRDIKPANLMVDAQGRLWITDFGLAQFRDDAGLTRTGDVLGTLRYMSPEQASGQRTRIDHRTDIYSLGATLYELVTLEPMFSEPDQHALLYQIIHDEPRPPRAIDKSVPMDLETIILKAVNKNPDDRYATAQEFADDLHRLLEIRPIKARRPTPAQRLRKWGKRHPSFVVTSVVILILLSGVSLATTALVLREKKKTDTAYESARAQADRAQEGLRHGRRSVDLMIQVCEEELAGQPALDGLRVRLLEKALADYQEFIEHLRDDPKAQAELTDTQDRVGKILADLAVMRGAGRVSRLENPVVRDDLRLSDEQREKADKLSGDLRDQRMKVFRNFQRLTPEERERGFLKLARNGETGLSEILSAVQLDRLRQIDLQLRGLSVFQDPDVEAALKLTASQRESIRKIETEGFFSPRGRPHGGPGPGGFRPDGPPESEDQRKVREKCEREERGSEEREKREKAMWTAADKVQKVLTEEQVAQWRILTGEPFKGTAGPFGPPPLFPPDTGPH